MRSATARLLASATPARQLQQDLVAAAGLLGNTSLHSYCAVASHASGTSVAHERSSALSEDVSSSTAQPIASTSGRQDTGWRSCSSWGSPWSHSWHQVRHMARLTAPGPHTVVFPHPPPCLALQPLPPTYERGDIGCRRSAGQALVAEQHLMHDTLCVAVLHSPAHPVKSFFHGIHVSCALPPPSLPYCCAVLPPPPPDPPGTPPSPGPAQQQPQFCRQGGQGGQRAAPQGATPSTTPRTGQQRRQQLGAARVQATPHEAPAQPHETPHSWAGEGGAG